MNNELRAVGNYSVFGVSVTHKGVLAMRATSPEKYAARMAVFKRDGDTCVTMVNLLQVMHKSEAAALLLASADFLKKCVTNGHSETAVVAFLTAQASGGARAIPTLAALTTLPVEHTVEQTAPEDTVEQTDTAELLEQQDADDAGETEAEPEATVAERKPRRGRR